MNTASSSLHVEVSEILHEIPSRPAGCVSWLFLWPGSVLCFLPTNTNCAQVYVDLTDLNPLAFNLLLTSSGCTGLYNPNSLIKMLHFSLCFNMPYFLFLSTLCYFSEHLKVILLPSYPLACVINLPNKCTFLPFWPQDLPLHLDWSLTRLRLKDTNI